jgi:hypothetical protein
MESDKIFNILKKYTGFELKQTEHGVHAHGAINWCPKCKEMSGLFYRTVHYPVASRKLESLPWTKIVKDPRNPQEGEYPTEDGVYITMMDCNEHEVCTNEFRDGCFAWMHKTHIKWWMKLPDDIHLS